MLLGSSYGSAVEGYPTSPFESIYLSTLASLIALDGKLYDLTNIDTPFGKLIFAVGFEEVPIKV